MRNKIICLFLMIVLAFTLSAGVTFATDQPIVKGTTYTYKVTCPKVKVNGNKYSNSVFTVNASKGKILGKCCVYGKSSAKNHKSGKCTLKSLTNISAEDRTAKQKKYIWVAWYAYNKSSGSAKWLKGKNGLKVTAALEYIRTGKGTRGFTKSQMSSYVTTAKSYIKNNSRPSTFKVWYATNSNSKYQSFIGWRDDSKYAVSIIKESTEESEEYTPASFEDIKYTVYKSDKSSVVGTLNVAEDGTSDSLLVGAAGTYYAKETETNDNYKLNEKWLAPVTLTTAAKTGIFQATGDYADEPQEQTIRIHKTLSEDSDEGGEVAGFEFTVTQKLDEDVVDVDDEEYDDDEDLSVATEDLDESTADDTDTGDEDENIEDDDDYDEDDSDLDVADPDGNEGIEFTGTTNDEGYVEFDESISDLFVDGDNTTVSVPAGEYDVTEFIPEDLQANYSFGEQGESATHTLEPGQDLVIEWKNVYKKQKQFLSIIKETDDGGVVSNFEFTVSNEDESVNETITTNANGTARIDDIEAGTYTATELMTDEQRARYEQPEAQTEEVTEDDGVTFTFTNVARTIPLSLIKSSSDGNISNIDFKLEGTGNYTDSTYANVSETATTDDNGSIDFESQLIAGTYTVTETGFNPEKYDVPEGYGTDENGNPQLTISIQYNATTEVLDAYADYNNDGEFSEDELISENGETGTVEFTNKPHEEDPESPSIETTAKAADTEEHFTFAGEDTTIIDTVSYKNVEADTEYVLEGSLINKDSEEVICEETATFTPETTSGEENIEFNFDASDLAGESVVVFEELKLNDKTVATHKDKNSEDQTVTFPEISTTLVDGNLYGHDTDASENMTLVDTVDYTNLAEGTYTLRGKLMSGEEEVAVDADGAEITQETELQAEGDGSCELEFSFNGSNYAGEDKLVAYEYLYYNDTLIASHADFEDDSQTVWFVEEGEPSIGTSATFNDDFNIVDTVGYVNLQDKEYTLKGTLMDKETGEVAKDEEGNAITATTEFTPEESNGQVDINFGEVTSDELLDTSLVAFEELYLDGELVASHKDLNDEEQTVHMLRTTAIIESNGTSDEEDSDKKTDSEDADKDSENTTDDEDSDKTETDKTNLKKVNVGTKTIVTDRVEYNGLDVGEEYTLTGMLVDKKTGEVVTDADNEKVVAETTFQTGESDGTINLKFEFDSTKMASSNLVAYEILKQDGKIVGMHADINDAAQTVAVIGTDSPQTGADIPIWLILALIIIVGGCTALKIRQRI